MNPPALPAGVQVFERGWLSANNILLTAGEKSVLIDSGYCTHAPQTLQLVDAGLDGRPLDVLVNTHLHSDHCGGNAAVQAQYPQLETWIPPGQAHHVMHWDPVALTYSPTGQLCPRFRFERTLQPGAEILAGSARWEIHAAPGHDPHSLIFFEPASRTLISADALWENGFGVVFPELEGADAFNEVAATLDVIERLQPKTVIPGHGKVFAYTPEILTRARHRLEAFVKSPKRHAHHAAKVLLKFK
ncbi:MAG: MBL fold metallo-hydrolase, partial [Polaromonas sp.]